MLRRFLFAALLLVWCAFLCRAQNAPPPPVSLIRAGRFLDVNSGHLLSNQQILVRGGKIEAVGERVAVPPGAAFVDLSRFTVLPGLIDCHTHLADMTDGEPLHVLERTAAENAYAVIPNARVTLLAGFTTVRDVGV